MRKDDVTHVADLGAHFGLAGARAQRGQGVRLGPPVLGIVLAAQLRPGEGRVELVREGVERLLLVVRFHLVRPQRLLVTDRVEQPGIRSKEYKKVQRGSVDSALVC